MRSWKSVASNILFAGAKLADYQQALADLGNSYELVRKMRVVPLQLTDFIAIVLPAVVPALPLLATAMPVSEIVKTLLHLLG